jgi:hypothetical protein
METLNRNLNTLQGGDDGEGKKYFFRKVKRKSLQREK